MALCVLDDAYRAADTGSAPPSCGLRLALALLYEWGDRRGECFDREPYETFWRRAIEPMPDEHARQVARLQELSACRNGIIRAADQKNHQQLHEALSERECRRYDREQRERMQNEL